MSAPMLPFAELAHAVVHHQRKSLSLRELDVLVGWLSMVVREDVTQFEQALALQGAGYAGAMHEHRLHAMGVVDSALFAGGNKSFCPCVPGFHEDKREQQLRRYRQLNALFHPDRHPADSEWATQRSQALQVVYRDFRRGQLVGAQLVVVTRDGAARAYGDELEDSEQAREKVPSEWLQALRWRFARRSHLPERIVAGLVAVSAALLLLLWVSQPMIPAPVELAADLPGSDSLESAPAEAQVDAEQLPDRPRWASEAYQPVDRHAVDLFAPATTERRMDDGDTHAVVSSLDLGDRDAGADGASALALPAVTADSSPESRAGAPVLVSQVSERSGDRGQVVRTAATLGGESVPGSVSPLAATPPVLIPVGAARTSSSIPRVDGAAPQHSDSPPVDGTAPPVVPDVQGVEVARVQREGTSGVASSRSEVVAGSPGGGSQREAARSAEERRWAQSSALAGGAREAVSAEGSGSQRVAARSPGGAGGQSAGLSAGTAETAPGRGSQRVVVAPAEERGGVQSSALAGGARDAVRGESSVAAEPTTGEARGGQSAGLAQAQQSTPPAVQSAVPGLTASPSGDPSQRAGAQPAGEAILVSSHGLDKREAPVSDVASSNEEIFHAPGAVLAAFQASVEQGLRRDFLAILSPSVQIDSAAIDEWFTEAENTAQSHAPQRSFQLEPAALYRGPDALRYSINYSLVVNYPEHAIRREGIVLVTVESSNEQWFISRIEFP